MSQSGAPPPSQPSPGSSGRPDEPPDGQTICKMLEVTFRNVWLRLMTSGVGAAYDAAIQAFVVACIAAYKTGYSLTALKFELSANEVRGNVMGKDIRLTEQEKETRMIWLILVYMTLARYGFKSERTPPPVASDLKGTSMEKLVGGLNALVDSVCDAAARGYNLQTFKMELSLMKADGEKPLSGAEASIRSQWTRIVFATVNILPDSLKRSR